jgi:hypothetical protein
MRSDHHPEAGGVARLNQGRCVELIRIAKKHDGVLRSEDVVKAAKDPQNALHPCFEWNNRIAGHEYRLMQARHLIRVHVTVLDNAADVGPVNVFVSLTPDRKEPGGGYRIMVNVLEDPDQRAMLLEDAARDFRFWKSKYQHLTELAQIFAAADQVFAADK